MKKVLAVASIGGHWIQLLRLAKGLEATYDVAYMSTHPKCAAMVEGHRFYQVRDFSRWDAYKVMPAFFSAIKVLRKERPDAVVTTGAAPGLIVLIAAKMLGKKTVWVDSLANVNCLSMCGRLAKRFFADRTFTQWQELSGEGLEYAGNVIG